MVFSRKELVRLPNGKTSWSLFLSTRELVSVGSTEHWFTLPSYKIIEKTGSKWEVSSPNPETTKTYVDTFPATWSESYDGEGKVKPSQYTMGRLYQGRYGKYNTIDNIQYNPIYWGVQRSLIGFDAKKIQANLKGARIQKIELYLKNEHFWYAKGGRAAIVSHSFPNKPNKFNYTTSVTDRYFTKGQGQWVVLPDSLGTLLKNGTISGFGLYRNTQQLDYYGYFSGATSSNRPVLRVTYTKNIYVSDTGDEYLTDESKPSEPKREKYTVKSGDSLWSISTKYGVTVSQLQEWNSLSGTLIHPGDVLIVYRKTDSSSVPAAVPKYTSVKQGEGLVQVTERLMRQGLLSQDFNTARLTLMNLNGFTTSAPMLHPGDQIMYSRS